MKIESKKLGKSMEDHLVGILLNISKETHIEERIKLESAFMNIIRAYELYGYDTHKIMGEYHNLVDKKFDI